jgi:hypothetical protein
MRTIFNAAATAAELSRRLARGDRHGVFVEIDRLPTKRAKDVIGHMLENDTTGLITDPTILEEDLVLQIQG